MGTPFITLLEPHGLAGYNRLALPIPTMQPPSVPKTFLDAMTVRRQVFVEEQHVAMENEFDADDRRSCHWVAYASVNRTIEPEVRDPTTGDIVRPRRSETSTVPVGTVRLVPFPHPPHPTPGASYLDGKLVSGGGGGDGAPAVGATVGAGERRTSLAPKFPVDRETELHDGVEPYVKLGRLAVVKEFRGYKIGRLLVRTALTWARKNPDYFMPSVAAVGLDQMGLGKAGSIPKWDGLVCCHAQQQVVAAWERMGFKVDKGMGTWVEEDIPHVGMFHRVDTKAKDDD